MDQSTSHVPGRAVPWRPSRNDQTDLVLVPRSSNEITTSITATGSQQARLRKQRSTTNMRALSQPVIGKNSMPPPSTPARQTIGPSSALSRRPSKGKERTSSLRNIVRRIFGSKPREAEIKRSSPPRHIHHRSDPEPFTKTPERRPENIHLPQRTLSAPLQLIDQQEVQRVRSPYAVQFPHSARLKPLDLGNPFYNQQHAPKRRASLPSVVLGELEAAAVAALIGKEKPRGAPEQPAVDAGVVLTGLNSNPRRRSRSVTDLRQSTLSPQPVRERNEEMKYWRESFTGSVLRTSLQERDEIDHDITRDNDTTPQPQPADPFTIRRSVSPMSLDRTANSTPPLLISRPVTAGGDSLDLEERVTKLEQGLAEFQNSLSRLTANTNRKTIIVDNIPPRKSRQHTPSILINTLRDPDYQAPQLEAVGEQKSDSYMKTTDTVWRPPRTPSPPGRTFTTLYRIINDERSLRRTLESQVRGLQENLAEVQYQLSRPVSTQPYSPRTPRPQYVQMHNRDSSGAGSFDPGHRVISRFSQSDSLTDSEAARMQEQREEGDEEFQTPLEAYHTPAEEFSRHRYTGSSGTDVMF